MRLSTRVILIACALLVLALGGLLLYEILRPHPVRVALVGLEGRQREGFLRALDDFAETGPQLKGTGKLLDIAEYANLDDILPLLESHKLFAPVPDIVIAPEALPINLNARLFAPVPHDIANRAPKSLRIGLSRDERLRAMPLLVNSLEIAGNRIWDSTLGHSPGSASWFESLRAARSSIESRTKVPLLVTGSDDELLSQIISALVLEEGGLESYTAVCTAISRSTDPTAALEALALGSFNAWDSALATLKAWTQDGLLPTHWLQMGKDDQALLLEEGRVIGLIQTLACRRDMPYQHIFNFRAAPFPAGTDNAASHKTVLAPAIVALVPENSRRREIGNALLNWLSTGDPLWQLARDCGWAAATTGTRQPDIQAMDSFSRSAASFSTVNGFLSDAFTNKTVARNFMTALREELSR